MRNNADLSAAIHFEVHTPCTSLPTFCPSCDFSHERKLWFRRGSKMFCHKCGYELRKKDYWHNEIVEEIEDFPDLIITET